MVERARTFPVLLVLATMAGCGGGNGATPCPTTAPTTCAGTCVDTSQDPANCGACGNVCPAGSVCQAGACCAATAWYADKDGDGFGDPSAMTMACAAPAGTVADHTDCDDTNPDVYPGAPELCDGVRDDCSDQAWTNDAGLASFHATGGGWTDYTAMLAAGTAASPVMIQVATAGTLNVCAGTWYAGFRPMQDFSLIGIGGRDAVVLDGGSSQRLLIGAYPVKIVVQGLTMTHGNASDYGGAVDVYNNGELHLTDVSVTDSSAGQSGGGIIAQDEQAASFQHVAITGCTATTGAGGGLTTYDTAQVNVDDLALVDDHAPQSDAGGWYLVGGTATIDRLFASANTAGLGGGVLSTSPQVTIQNSTLSANVSNGNGGGWWQKAGTIAFDHVVFANNSAGTNAGGAVFLLQGAAATITGCLFTANSATNGGAFALDATESATVTDSTFTGNDVSDSGTSYSYGSGASFTCTAGVCM